MVDLNRQKGSSDCGNASTAAGSETDKDHCDHILYLSVEAGDFVCTVAMPVTDTV